ncbi:MAG: diaminopimelate epimerase [Prevotella sp.]
MRRTIRFTKMHGAGNDYIYVNTAHYPIPDPSAAAVAWSRYHFGIGSDGLVLIDKAEPESDADFTMHIFNADGSEAMMCGNASRCIGKYLYDKGLTDKKSIKLQTLSGIKTLELHLDKLDSVDRVTLDMLEPKFDVKEQFDEARANDGHLKPILAEAGCEESMFVSMGNPHFVLFLRKDVDLDNLDIRDIGSRLEKDNSFPQRCNIEFAKLTSPGVIRTRVWERGSGITMACGTGACATAVSAARTKRCPNKSSIVMDGGTLNIEWRKNNHVYLTGPAAFVFEGEIELP